MFSRNPSAAPSRERSRTRGVLSGLSLVAASAFVLVTLVSPTATSFAEPAALQSEGRPGQGLAAVSGEGATLVRDTFVMHSPTPTPTPTPEPVAAVAEAPAAEGAAQPQQAASIAIPTVAAPSPGSAQAVAAQMVAARGWGGDQFSCLVSLWNRESGWNVYASNASSGAYGIPQALPGSKMATAGADWRTNAATQIEWGLGYISARYGTPCGAWGHSQSVGWY